MSLFDRILGETENLVRPEVRPSEAPTRKFSRSEMPTDKFPRKLASVQKPEPPVVTNASANSNPTGYSISGLAGRVKGKHILRTINAAPDDTPLPPATPEELYDLLNKKHEGRGQ